ncbi:MAG: carboxypeptidase-like regulatory domain-containing protein, partial [Chitinophagaceae bacterium]|nr:carboxypeptidase-like regulatory domain-containing protein [Chitinophagaceae bacterium]
MKFFRVLSGLVLFLFNSYGSFAQSDKVTLSGHIIDDKQTALPYVNVAIYNTADTSFVIGTVSDEEGRFSIEGVGQGNYLLKVSYLSFKVKYQPILVGRLSQYLDVGGIVLTPETNLLEEATITEKRDAVTGGLDKKTFNVSDNASQAGGSVLDAMKNIPGITAGQDGKVQLRGSDKVIVLVDGKQTALTGFGNQSGLDNIPASAIEKIEVINNPSAKYDANGNAGIINIVFKKESQEGLSGKAGMAVGVGALWIKKENYPTIRPQYQATPKLNPSLSLNYRKKKINLFVQADDLYKKSLNKNEFVDRYY